MIEVQVRIDHQADIGGAHPDPGQRVGGGAVDHAPVAQEIIRAANTGIDQGGPAGVDDDEPGHGPFPAIGPAQGGQVQPPNLQGHPVSRVVSTRSATAAIPAALGWYGAPPRSDRWKRRVQGVADQA